MSSWELVYDGYDPRVEGVRETLTTLGNGYFATRGATLEAAADGIHYPGTYIAGCYNRLTTTIEGRANELEDAVNVPNWLHMSFRHFGEDWERIGSIEVLRYRRVLDLKHGVLLREIRVRDMFGRITNISSRRIVHMAEPHLGGVELTLTPENWSGRIEVLSTLDGWITNSGVERYRFLANRHLDPAEACAIGGDTMVLAVRTVQSGILIAEAARTRVFGCSIHERRTLAHQGYIAHEIVADVEATVPVRFEKVVSIYTSRDHAISNAKDAAVRKLAEAPDFDDLQRSHELAWEQLWRSFEIDLDLEGDDEADAEVTAILRLHIFHLLQTASRNTIDLDVGIPARGLHGEGYRGHVFWDELFVFPFLNLRMPDITHGLLLYRFRRLDSARHAAREAGHRGAMFPWQSGSDGSEETPRIGFNPRSGRWVRDSTHLQRHVGAAIAYNVWQYFQVTGDLKFLENAGAELLLEIARFLASLATHDEANDRYDIRGVMGPDEYHSAYPGAPAPGLVNNAYTNMMTVWVLCRAFDALEVICPSRSRELCESLDLRGDELARWDAISRKLRVPFLENGVIEQFAGYGDLQELDWDAYRARYGDIHRLDRILESEGDSPNNYKVSKQADVLMLFYLFSAEELCSLFSRIGYVFTTEMIPRTVDYYLRRTSDGSTLSRVAHAWVLARCDRATSWQLFREALMSDVADIQGGTTREGIHIGAMAGTVDLLQRCYTGLELRNDVLWIRPRLPVDVHKLSLVIRYRTHVLALEVTHDGVDVTAAHGTLPPVRIGIRDVVYELHAGEQHRFALG